MRLLRALAVGLAVLVGMVVLGEAVARASAMSPRAASVGALLWLAAVPLAIGAAVAVARRAPRAAEPARAGAPGRAGATASAPGGGVNAAADPAARAAGSIGRRVALAGAALGLAAIAVALAYPVLAPAPPPENAAAEASPGCWLRFELRVLRAAIPEVVGDCLENARRDPVSGDTVQRTTGGLLVLRQTDRRAAFTDGARTWVQGPEGIATRLNEERFDWEPTASTPTVGPAPAAAPGPAPPAPAPAPSQPTAAPAVTKPAATPAPPTPTVRSVVVTGSGAPGSPPTPTATAGPASDPIVDAVLVGYLRRSGLPLADVRALAPAADPEGLLGRPGGPISKVAFRDQRTPGAEQWMEMYADAAVLRARAPRLNDPAQGRQAFTSPGSRIALRLSKGMAAEQLRSYERWLQTLR